MIFSQVRLSVYWAQGTEKNSKSDLAILYFGGGRELLYLLNLMYSEVKSKNRLGSVFFWRIHSYSRRKNLQADMIFTNSDIFFMKSLARKGFLSIPEWVSFKLDLSLSIPEIWKRTQYKGLKDDLRKIRKYHYSYEMTHDRDTFNYFYRRMYLPYIKKRFQIINFFTGYHLSKLSFEKGGLLLAKRGNEFVSGIIIVPNKDKTKTHVLGVKEGKFEYVKQGALSALYYSSCLWAKDNGYRWMDFGECRSFLRDGLLNYKKKWKMEVEKSRHFQTIFGLKICHLSQEVRSFLSYNPFIFLHQAKLKGMFPVQQNHPLSVEEIRLILKNYFIRGLDGLVILSMKGFTPQTMDYYANPDYRRICLIQPSEESFLKTFPQIFCEANTSAPRKNSGIPHLY
ncbi:MAG: hypothetical protein WCC06_11355 [Candidatus Aminicenantales bacterium]